MSKAFMGKLGRFRSLMWHRLPANATLEQVFELMMDQVLEQRDPSLARRVARNARSARGQTRYPPADSLIVRLNIDPPVRARRQGNPRHIPARVRDAVFVRDEGRCAFVGSTGRRCGSTHGLQVDHVVPVARGGGATLGNLRLLCANHNRLEGERILGRAAMARAAPAVSQ